MALTPLDFPASPTVGQLYPDPPVTGQPTYRWDGAQWLSYAAASLPTPTKPNNYGKKNYIINGAMMISQEWGMASFTVSLGYPVDQFIIGFVHGGTCTYAQVASATPGGSPNRIRYIATAADTSVAASDAVYIKTPIEGLRTADLRFGSVSAKTITIQFGVKAPAGTYCVGVLNGAVNRSYVVEYVIAAGEANTDVVKSVTIPGDTTGTWAVDNTAGLNVFWSLMAGTSNQQAAGSWAATAIFASPNQFNFMGTINNVFELFDVSLTEGSVAPPFQVPDYASELAACQRYWRTSMTGTGIATNTTTARLIVPHPSMRASPAVSVSSAIGITDIYAAATAQSSGAVSASVNNADGGHYDFPNFTGLTAGRFYTMSVATAVPLRLNARL